MTEQIYYVLRSKEKYNFQDREYKWYWESGSDYIKIKEWGDQYDD